MIQSFPQIKKFFKANVFSGEDLNNLIKKIDEVYLDYHINKKAKTLIKLELMKFELQKKEKEYGNDLGIKNRKDNKAQSIEKTNKTGKNVNKKRPSSKDFIELKLTSIKSGR